MERVHPLSGLPAAVRSRPFRFGVVAANPRSPQDWLDKARRVEDLGYASLVVPDNLQYTLAPLPALAMAAAVTRSLRVGTYVLANDFRNPVLLAKDAATLDLLSGGRLELGIGAGRPGSELENRMLGLPFDSAAAARVGRLREALAIIKPLLAGERASAHGGTYTAQEAEVSPRPAQQPRPPILIAGGGRQMLALAAREADIIGLAVQPDASLDVAAEKIEWIMEAAGERFAEIELNINLMAVGNRVPHHVATQMKLDAAELARRGSVAAATGSVDEMCETLQARRETLGISYALVADELADEFAPVVARLAGR